MRVYVINELQGFRAFVDAEGIHIEKYNNLGLKINTRYMELLIRFYNECKDLNALYAELCYRLEGDYATVWKEF